MLQVRVDHTPDDHYHVGNRESGVRSRLRLAGGILSG